MPTCWNRVSTRFEDGRHLAMSEGARAAGFDVVDCEVREARPVRGDVLLFWNLHGSREAEAEAARKAGAQIIVAEEGFTRGLHPVSHFAMALDGHNGSGRWYPGGPERWEALRIPVEEWRTDGEYILVCGQRGIGAKAMASPPNWHEDVARRLRAFTDRPVVVRPHPGKNKAAAPNLDGQLSGAWAVVVWSSGCAFRALVLGVPVIYEAPHHVLCHAMGRDVARVNNPLRPDRRVALERMAWAQWSLDEIRAGLPFRHLLGAACTSTQTAA